MITHVHYLKKVLNMTVFPKPEDTEASQRNPELRNEGPEEPYNTSEAN